MNHKLSGKIVSPKNVIRIFSTRKLICGFSRILRHLLSESQLFVGNILYKVAHTNLSIASLLSHFLKKYCMSDASEYWQEGFIHSFYSSLWKNFNQSFFKNGRKTTHRFGQTSQNSPWMLFISERWGFTFMYSKHLTCGFGQITFGLFLPNTFVWIVFILIFEKILI